MYRSQQIYSFGKNFEFLKMKIEELERIVREFEHQLKLLLQILEIKSTERLKINLG